MRAKLAQIKRIREIRLDSRKREWAAERQQLVQIEGQIAELRNRRGQLEKEAAARMSQFTGSGGRLSGPEIASLRGSIEALRQEAAEMVKQIQQAEQVRQQAIRRVQAANNAMRAAQRGVDQFSQLDEKLAEEENKEFERREEAENEILPKLKKRPIAPQES